MRHARDLPVLVHADVLVVDLAVVGRQRIDHHLVHHAVPLVVDAGALSLMTSTAVSEFGCPVTGRNLPSNIVT